MQLCEDGDESMKRLRAETEIVIGGPNKKIKKLTDVCVIYGDGSNIGHFIAHSLQTNRVGMGRTSSEAYLDLILGLAQAIRYINSTDHEAGLGEPAPEEVQEKYDGAHRLPKAMHKRLTDYASGLLRQFNGSPEELVQHNHADGVQAIDLKDETTIAYSSANFEIEVANSGQLAVA